MIRRIWTVRSVPKLFWWISFTLSILMFGFTALNIAVFDSPVTFGIYENSTTGISMIINKYLLIILPALSLVICCLLKYFSNKTLKKEEKKSDTIDTILVGNCFILSLFFTIYQNNILSSIKSIGRFSPIISIILIIAFIVYTPTMLIKNKKILFTK